MSNSGGLLTRLSPTLPGRRLDKTFTVAGMLALGECRALEVHFLTLPPEPEHSRSGRDTAQSMPLDVHTRSPQPWR
ncbi:hypothetical protein GQ53DRAFT_747636 [Thozetella sp. PMI_491]|nr:hypothetical protein GQ53DRAFT_747636 [Thozetella sp. PMI_491]